MPHRYYTRRFLNKRGFHAGAYVLACVEDTSKRREARVWPTIELTLADCGRQISLDFSTDPTDLANSLHKVDVLVDTLTRFRAALVAEGRLSAEREARARAGKKAAPQAAPRSAPVPGAGPA